ncbi:MAG: serine hydrolase [Chitinophagaceae bacterium]|nr:serine hydrolase [Chitinophagaceae bacterium]
MKHFFCLFLSLAFLTTLTAQPVNLKKEFKQPKWFSDSLKQIIADAGLDGSYDVGEDGMEQVSFAVIDLTNKKPLLGGVNMDNFIYPASVYKMYVGMEVLKQVSEGKYSLNDAYIVRSPNDVDRSSEIKWDPRPLLRAGDTVTIGYLLDLMITRSDNSAANCMIDIAGRENINATMHRYGWFGSEVTRKFLSRKYEDPGYDTTRGTETSALHAALFMYKIYRDDLVNFWVSRTLKDILSMQLDTTKLATGLPRDAVFAHKSGWWNYYTNDVGIVESDKIKFVISLFTPVTEDEVRPKMKTIAERVYQLLLRRNKKG